MSDGDDTGYSRNEDGEVCRCSLSRDSGCTPNESGVPDPPRYSDDATPHAPAPADDGEPTGLCGRTFWGCADIRCGSGVTWTPVDEPICPRAYGGTETRGVAAGIMAGMVEEWIGRRRDCLVHALNAHESPIGTLSRCGIYPEPPSPAPN